LIDDSEKRISRLSFEFRVRMLLKGAVIRFCNVEQKKRDVYSSWVGCWSIARSPQNLSGFVFLDGETHCESKFPKSFRTQKAIAKFQTL